MYRYTGTRYRHTGTRVNDGTPVVDSGKIGDARSEVSVVPRYQVSTHTGEDPR